MLTVASRGRLGIKELNDHKKTIVLFPCCRYLYNQFYSIDGQSWGTVHLVWMSQSEKHFSDIMVCCAFVMECRQWNTDWWCLVPPKNVSILNRNILSLICKDDLCMISYIIAATFQTSPSIIIRKKALNIWAFLTSDYLLFW